jgi:hypothetical protein
MPCLFAILALLTPRLVIALLWLFTNWFHGAFHAPFASPLVPMVLGFVFLPTTLLWYVAVQHWFGGHWTAGPVIGLVVALLIDVSPASGRRRPRND